VTFTIFKIWKGECYQNLEIDFRKPSELRDMGRTNALAEL
jgi:hypothetical protein